MAQESTSSKHKNKGPRNTTGVTHVEFQSNPTDGLHYGFGALRVPIAPKVWRQELQELADNQFVWSLLRKRFKSSDPNTIVQDAWCHILKFDPKNIRNSASTRAFVAAVVKRAEVDYIRGQQRESSRTRSGSHEYIEQQCKEAKRFVDGPEEVVEQQQRWDVLLRLISLLRPSLRETVEHLVIHGLTVEEVARRRGVAVPTVWRDFGRAIDQLSRESEKVGVSYRRNVP